MPSSCYLQRSLTRSFPTTIEDRRGGRRQVSTHFRRHFHLAIAFFSNHRGLWKVKSQAAVCTKSFCLWATSTLDCWRHACKIDKKKKKKKSVYEGPWAIFFDEETK
ncbi:hypothetical protein CDAR_618491 [Caerostris darwini]|uniref:Uncharacterized protein n=1 Tax=Caerostris darwini TaxID=1538125 RepID=A0AAV4SUV3_9ARAC|nr:hypothetical protein CDAR_618491 [Caerostris darwini]